MFKCAIEGQFNVVSIQAKSIQAAPVTRHALLAREIALANPTDIGDFVAVEICENQNKEYMIWMVK